MAGSTSLINISFKHVIYFFFTIIIFLLRHMTPLPSSAALLTVAIGKATVVKRIIMCSDGMKIALYPFQQSIKQQ